MRLLPRLVIVLAVCLIAIALPAVPAQAQCGGPFIELSLKSGLPGTEVIVYGYDFAEGVLVDIYYDGNLIATDRTSSEGDFTVMITIPEGCQGHHQVFVQGKYASVDTYFTVKPGLTISPETGSVGTNVTVKGLGFAKNEEGIELMYYLNDSYETVERNIIANAQGSWETTFRIPSSTRGEHKLDAQGAVSRLYEVKDATFKVTPEISLDKSSGIVGESITMTGSRFAANEKGIQILFAGQAVVTGIKANAQGDWEKTFEVPDMPTGEYSVTAEGEQTKKEDIGELSFEIKHDIMLSPDGGHVGIDLTVTGRGFAANEDVVIMYDDSQVVTAETNDQGSFEVSFLVPESKYGERQVIARDATGSNTTAIFTMESNHPSAPALISPSNGSRVGLIGNVTPTFEWSAVSDDSGVRYSLQIATSANFSASSVIVSVTDLTETSYTLTEALPYGTYYWIVQAVDGAENESGWTAAHSFRVGLLPLWAFIAIIVAIVVLLVALVRTLVIRRTVYYDRW
jgi:hypothetical protein